MLGVGSELRTGWKIIALVLLSGTYLGWEVAANHTAKVYAASPSSQPPIRTERVVFPHTSTVAVVSIPTAISTEQSQARELARLKARTRRLEALVKVLQDRKLESEGREARR
jgi:hypothetical protein